MSSNTTATGGQGGMASDTKTPASVGVGHDRPKAMDEQGVIGKEFTGMQRLSRGNLGAHRG